MSGDFSTDQKRYLEGFVSGLQSARAARGLAPIGGTGVAGSSEPTGPDAIHLKAQDRTVAAGGKLAEQGLTPIGAPQAEFVKFLHDEDRKWAPIIKAANIKLD